jgi:salicylate 5-hydroxylase large subunit
VSADDGEVIEWSQEGFEQNPSAHSIVEMGGSDHADSEHMVTETLIRGMYTYWREVMER